MSCPPGCDPDLLADGLMSLGGRGVEEREGVATTYLIPPLDPESFARDAQARLRVHTGSDDLSVSWRWQVQEDWAEYWKRGLDVRRVTPRIVVHPSWLDPEPRPGELVIQLDPGMAFGTAEHGTTRGCLRLLDPLVRPDDRILDVGTGSGILAIAAAMLGARTVQAVDLDPLACDAARENAAINGVADRVAVAEVSVTPAWLDANAPADGVVANLETHLLLPLMPALCRCPDATGWLLLSGILVHERDSILRSVQEAGGGLLVPEAEDRDGEWWSGVFRRSPQGVGQAESRSGRALV